MKSVDTAVIGGGVIGLSCALALAERGQSVVVIDDARPGRATRAAAGMLAPLAEADSPGFFVRRGIESLSLYPGYLERIREASGIDVPMHGPGLLRIARTEDAERLLCKRLSWQLDLPLPQIRLSRLDLLSLEPKLPDDVRCGALSFQEKHLEPRKLQSALEAACFGRDVSLLRAQGKLAFDGDHLNGIRSAEGDVVAANYVIAGGVWSAELLERLGLRSEAVYPVKGQACLVDAATDAPTRHTVYTHEVYIVPRPDGKIVIGATQQPDAGYSATVDEDRIDGLRNAAEAFIPGTGSLPMVESWSGLRPFSADGLPIVGRVPAHENVYAAAGHGRNGVLFAPLTARLIESAVVDRSAPEPELDPARFAA